MCCSGQFMYRVYLISWTAGFSLPLPVYKMIRKHKWTSKLSEITSDLQQSGICNQRTVTSEGFESVDELVTILDNTMACLLNKHAPFF